MSSRLIALGIDRMSVAERESLIEEILESIPEDDHLEPTPEFRAELLRRSAEVEANPGDCIPWEEVRDAALRRHGLAP